ncbi:hypothetical protein AGMMS49975_25790 [Clostridia bacterium]|nr:hypothetical protein AGMMS49975_25790 [Clostridia bacterium]
MNKKLYNVLKHVPIVDVIMDIQLKQPPWGMSQFMEMYMGSEAHEAVKDWSKKHPNEVITGTLFKQITKGKKFNNV